MFHRLFFGAGDKGIGLFINNGIIQAAVKEEVNPATGYGSTAINGNAVNRVVFSWDGLIGTNNAYFNIIEYEIVNNEITEVSNVTTTFSINKQWIGMSSNNIALGHRDIGVNNFNGEVYNSRIEVNNAGLSHLPLAVGNGNLIYDKDFEIEYTISGTVTAANWIKQDFYHHNINDGFTLDGLSYIPSSNLNPGFDVKGNVLTNPPVNGHNNAESLLKWPDVDSLKDADNLNLLYDASGIAKELSYSDLIDNPYFRIDTQGNNSKTKALLFSRNLTAEENQYIDEYYANSNN